MMKLTSLFTIEVVGITLACLLVSSIALGTVPRYSVETVADENMVSDAVTGLVWQQQSTSVAGGLDWKAALAHCEELEFAQETDWRLPAVTEITSIVDEKKNAAPAINTIYFADFNPAAGYWVSTTSRTSASSAYAVYFNDQNNTVGRGGVSAVSKTSKLMVLCVRGDSK
jgi:Protein of unknown function (DUF1566)